ncbi:MAG: hypothetical protein JOZ98_21215 [Solirubrobacterales bacterium]|nr:hypothetical protein [Solirubrobacterales bacterium]MBV9425441.1 hypothetical protein [Solirubrobacterales bacterium]MBV9798271.1 hypothetical protein [Solirubrobacterales bacterium]
MPKRETRKEKVERLRRGPPSVTLPVVHTSISLPDKPGLLWYAGLGAMAAAEFVEWPIALLLAGTHFVENHSRNRDVQALAEGVDTGA